MLILFFNGMAPENGQWPAKLMKKDQFGAKVDGQREKKDSWQNSI